jgi:hypothetical protein
MTPLSNLMFFNLLIKAILYGVYLVTLLHCLRWLVFDDEGWHVRRRIKWTFLIISMFIFLLATTDVGISLWMILGPAANTDQPNLFEFRAIDVRRSGSV